MSNHSCPENPLTQTGQDYRHPHEYARRVGGCLQQAAGYPVAGNGSAGSTVTRKPNFSRRRTIWLRSRAS